MTINDKKPTRSEREAGEAHLNWMGGPSFQVTPLVRLRMAAASCFFGEPMYYQGLRDEARGEPSNRIKHLSNEEIISLRETLNALDPQEWRAFNPQQMMETAIDDALAFDPEGTLRIAVQLRDHDHIRVTPQVIMVRAAHHKSVKGTGLVVKYGPQIIRRMDEPATQLAYHTKVFPGKPIPNSLKKAWAATLEGASTYNLAKYTMRGRVKSTVDVVNVCHPQHTYPISRLVKGDLSLDGETWEAILSAHGASQRTWEEAIPTMGHMALLRNLRNFIQHNVPKEAYLGRLVNTAEGGQQMPFRYYSAYRAVEEMADPSILDAIESAMVIALGDLPRFKGKVITLSDNSGSAHGATTSAHGSIKISTIGNLMGVITALLGDEGWSAVFGDRLEILPIRKRSSIFDQLKKLESAGKEVGRGTENGIWLFLDKAIKEKLWYDHIFIYSDMQAGHGGLYGIDVPSMWRMPNKRGYHHYVNVPALVREYRKTVNPNVMVYLTQIAGYQDTIIPEYYDKTYILGGWSDSVIRFAAAMSRLYQTTGG